MPNISFRRRAERVEPGVLAERLRAALAEALPGAIASVEAGDGSEVVVRWEDGPAAGTVADVVAGAVNWEVRSPAAAPSKEGAPSVVLARAFSEAALAVAVVRHRASNVRPYDSADPAAVTALVALLEVDEPARSGYPVPDAVADLVLAAPDPEGLAARLGPDPSPADRLSAKLDLLGYDRLWHQAWSSVS